MNYTSATSLITGSLTTFGSNALIIVTAVIGLGLGFLLFRWGWKKVKGSMN